MDLLTSNKWEGAACRGDVRQVLGCNQVGGGNDPRNGSRTPRHNEEAEREGDEVDAEEDEEEEEEEVEPHEEKRLSRGSGVTLGGSTRHGARLVPSTTA